MPDQRPVSQHPVSQHPVSQHPVSQHPAQPAARPLLRTMIGEVLRRTRLEQGRTLADVARAAQVSMPYLSEVERGRKEASSEVLAAICAALRIGLSDLLSGAGRLAAPPARPAGIIRLGGFRSHRAAARPAGPPETTALLAA